MRRRILLAILSIAALAILLFAVPLAVVAERFVDDDAMLRLERQAILATRDVPSGFAVGDDPVELPAESDDTVLALYDVEGRLVAGSGPAIADAPTRRALDGSVTDAETGDSRIVAVPLSADEQIIGAIRAEQSTAASSAQVRRIIVLLAALATAVLAIGAAIGYVVAGRLARPVRRLRDAAVQIGDGDFALRVPRAGIPEIDQATVAMTATARRLEELVARERSFSSDASHQMRTPLAGLRAAIETELEFPRADRTAILHDSLNDIDRLERTVDELLTIARSSGTDERTVMLDQLFRDIDANWRGSLAVAGRPLSIDDPHALPPVRGDATALRHALDVLLDNALNHGAGEVHIGHRVGGHTVTLTVTDEGPGFTGPGTVAAPDSPSAKSSPHGLGLPLARRLVEALPGRLVISRTSPNPRIQIVLERADSPPT